MIKQLVAVCIVVVLLAVNGTRLHAQEQAPLRVVAVTAILADFVHQVGGPHVSVTALVPPGVDLHDWQPTPADIVLVREAELLVVNGLGLEGWLDRAIQQTGGDTRIVVASQGVAALVAADDHQHDGHNPAHDHDIDPHAWMSVPNAMRYVENIRAGLIEARPEHEATFRSLSELYLGQLRVLDAWIKREAARIPADRRVIVCDHDAFQYFGRTYGFQTVALTDSLRAGQPSPRDMADAVTFVRNLAVPAVFAESGANRKVLEALAREAGIVVGGELIVHGTPDGGIESYVEMHRSNMLILSGGLR